MPSNLSQFRGCLLGGAVGDALGAAVEFLRIDEIRARFGPDGITDYAPAYGRIGAITDDTQMTLFTAEGLLRAHVRHSARGICSWPGVIRNAYRRWHVTQAPDADPAIAADGWLIAHPKLHQRRAPGATCIAAMQAIAAGGAARNDSKGCGGVMRVAPIGLYASHRADLRPTFDLACEAAAITHGHRTGQVASGAFAAMIHQLVRSGTLQESVDAVLALLRDVDGAAETIGAIEAAVAAAASGQQDIEAMGQGWIAEEALAMGLHAALLGRDVRDVLIRAVNHSGDSDSTGSIAGQLAGAMWGEESIPATWLDRLELRDVIATMADDLHDARTWDASGYAPPRAEHEAAMARYPGC